MKKLLSAVLPLLLSLCLLCPGASAETTKMAEAGSFRADWFSGGAMGIRFIPVGIDEEAGILCVWPTDNVSDVVLEEIVPDADFACTRVIWTAGEMASNDVLCIQAYLYDVLPRFRIRCVNAAGETECRYIGDSGEDGSLLLIAPEEIEGFLPVIMPGLSACEVQHRALKAYLAQPLPVYERAFALKALYELWENQRITAWGGYAMTEAEYDRYAGAGDAVQNAALYADDRCAALAEGYEALAEEVRAHVYQLAGKPLPEE